MGSVFVRCAVLALVAGFVGEVLGGVRAVNTAAIAYQPAEGLAHIRFDISWRNSWRYTNTNHDAAWVFFKTRSEDDGVWEHATLAGAGINPAGYLTGYGTEIEFIVPDDGIGVFVRRAAEGSGGVEVTNACVVWNFSADGLTDLSGAEAQAFAIEMVYVAAGVNTVGSGGTESGSFTDGSWTDGATIPFEITSEDALKITNSAGCLWGTSSVGNNTIGGAGKLPAEFPKGYAAFYCMKYDITQGQYRDFLNTLTRRQQDMRTASQEADYFAMSASPTIINRNGIRCPSDIPDEPGAIVFGCDGNDNKVFNEDDDGQDWACNYLSWLSGCAFADWSGLRPMTELEFEKACRGSPDVPYWGIKDMNGNEWIRVVTVGCEDGRAFTGLHGDGVLGAGGNANVAAWPRHLHTGAGYRGGPWFGSVDYRRASCRFYAAPAYEDRRYDTWRGVRTAPPDAGP